MTKPKNKKRKNRRSNGSESDTMNTPKNKKSTLDRYFNLQSEQPSSMENLDSVSEHSSNKEDIESVNENDTSKLSERELLLQNNILLQKIAKDVESLKQNDTYQDKDISELKTKVTELEINQVNYEQQVRVLKMEVKALKREQLESKAYSMRLNLILQNVEKEANENLPAKVERILRDNLKVTANIMFDAIHRTGRGNNDIVVRFHKLTDRHLVWKQRFNLRGSKYILKEHLPDELERNRLNLMPLFKEAKKQRPQGTFMVRDTIIHDGKRYTIDNANELFTKLGSKDLGALANKDVYAFLGRFSPLSNFFQHSFEFKGTSYLCAEQAYQVHKARHCGRPDIAENIMSLSNPVFMKGAGDAIDNRAWIETGDAEKCMEDILTAKFAQCEVSRNTLVQTATRYIAEASPNLFWGTGVRKHESNALKRSSFKGKNTLGVVLMKIRQQFV